jgi:hydroxyacylglutathione hydrolase
LFFRQVLYPDLGCASYMIGCGGEAIVIDARWDIDVYIELARAERLRIAHVIDTHDHADHVSGRLRLAAATGARSYRSEPGGNGEIKAGDEIAIGAVRLRAIATPGHRPEHLSFAVIDLKRNPEPWMLITGDSLLVGDVARPDLAYEPAEGARALHTTLRRLAGFGDHVEVWPAHVGGSLCGGAGLSHKTSSTVGFELRSNPLLLTDEAQFVTGLTASLPSRPPNIERIVSLNQRPEYEAPSEPAWLEAPELRRLLATGVTVLDSRQPGEFDAGHVAGAINLPVGAPGVGTRAGWALEPDARLLIVSRDAGQARQMVSALQAVGFLNVEGCSLANASAWGQADVPVAEAGSWDLDQVAAGLRADAVELVDVRELDEWVTGHIPGSHHFPLHRLRDVDDLPLPANGRMTAVACAAGMRAAFAASLFRRAGRHNVVRVAGGGVPDLGAHGLELRAGVE